jgi:hypothetical protein
MDREKSAMLRQHALDAIDAAAKATTREDYRRLAQLARWFAELAEEALTPFGEGSDGNR